MDNEKIKKIQNLIHRHNTVGVIRNGTLVFRELHSLRCINFKNLCAYHQEEVLSIPKHPKLAQFNGSGAK